MTAPGAKLEYRIEQGGDKFIAIDSEQDTVGVYATEKQAHADIERAKKEDAIWERSKELMRNAVRTIMANSLWTWILRRTGSIPHRE